MYLSKKKGGGGEVKVTNVVWLFDFFNDWQFWLFKFFLIKELSISIISKSKNHQSPITNYGISKTSKSQQSINNHKDDFFCNFQIN